MRRAAKVDRNQSEIVAALDRFGRDTSNNNYRAAGLHTCAQCGTVFQSYSRRRYCGQDCYHLSRQTLVARPCERCGCNYQPDTVSRRFCSKACAVPPKAPPRQKKQRGPKPYTCWNCGGAFLAYPSSNRKFCGYQCFLKSGGAQRAGDAAAMAKSKYGAKKDANHSEIFEAIAQITAVKDLSDVGRGVPDGIAWIGSGWQLFDVKNPLTGYGKRGLNARQRQWISDWRGGPVYLIYTVEEALRFARGQLDGLKVEQSGALEAIGIPFRGQIE